MASLIMATTYTGILEAHIARGRLEAEGIPVTLHNEHHIATDWLISNAIGGVKLMVAASNLEQARDILQSCEAGEYDIAPEINYSDGLSCPSCDSTNISSDKPWLAILLGLIPLNIYSLVMARSRTHHKCERCNYRWHRWFEESDTKSLDDELLHEQH